MPPFVTYALLVLAAIVLIAGFVVERRKGRLQKYAWILQVGAFAFAYLVLRPGSAHDPVGSLRDASASRAPVFLDLYSNY